LELRASISLARFYRQQGRRDASDILRRSYSSFTEGFATPALQEAKALMEELQIV
jgi:predicted ATPase